MSVPFRSDKGNFGCTSDNDHNDFRLKKTCLAFLPFLPISTVVHKNENAAAAAKLVQSTISEMKESPSLLLSSDFKEEIPVEKTRPLDSCSKLSEEQTLVQANVVVRDENSAPLVNNKLVVNEPVEIKVGADVVSVIIKEMINTVNSELEKEETQTSTQMNTEDFSNVESSISDCEMKVESMSESEENILKEKKLLYPLTDDSYNLLSNTSSQINIEDSSSHSHEHNISSSNDANNCTSNVCSIADTC